MKIYITILHYTDKYTFIMPQLQQSNFNSEFQGIKNWAFVLINFQISLDFAFHFYFCPSRVFFLSDFPRQRVSV